MLIYAIGDTIGVMGWIFPMRMLPRMTSHVSTYAGVHTAGSDLFRYAARCLMRFFVIGIIRSTCLWSHLWASCWAYISGWGFLCTSSWCIAGSQSRSSYCRLFYPSLTITLTRWRGEGESGYCYGMGSHRRVFLPIWRAWYTIVSYLYIVLVPTTLLLITWLGISNTRET